jgi:hypothetical protein
VVNVHKGHKGFKSVYILSFFVHLFECITDLDQTNVLKAYCYRHTFIPIVFFTENKKHDE